MSSLADPMPPGRTPAGIGRPAGACGPGGQWEPVPSGPRGSGPASCGAVCTGEEE